MARINKKAQKEAEEARSIVDRLLSNLNPGEISIALLGGTASMFGITPPFTRLLMMVSGAAGGDPKSQEPAFWDAWKVAVPMFAVFDWLIKKPDGSYNPPPDGITKEDIGHAVALFSSGALEAVLMYRAMSNPEVVTTALKMPAELLKGVGEIVPG